jgi:hypothetical protein
MKRSFAFFTSALFVFLLFPFVAASAADLKPKTIDDFNKYVDATAARFPGELRPGGAFLYIDGLSAKDRKEAVDKLKAGEVLVEKRETKAPGVTSDIPDGIIHHWVALVFVPGVTMAQTLPVVQDYDHRAELYKPEVIASHLISRQGDDFKMFMRLYEKRFTTVIFNTEYAIHWGSAGPGRMYSDSISTRIQEVKDNAHPDGEELPAGHDRGYLWRLNTYWRFEESDGGVYVQCEAVSLTRDIPTGLGWLLKPLVTSIPKHSLGSALGRTREVIIAKSKK